MAEQNKSENCGLPASGVLDLLNRMAEATETETVWTLLVDAMAPFGFERVNYALTRGLAGTSIGDPHDVYIRSTHSPERVRAHHETGHYLRTAEYRWVLENVGAVSWGWVAQERAAGRLSESECAAMDSMQARRRRAGISISFAEGGRRYKGAMGLAAHAHESQAALDLRWPRISARVMAICNMAHLKFSHLPLPVRSACLNQRQRELLEWVADGKTMQDIQVLTGLSVSAIEKHLRKARDALGVETTAQAVAKAAFLNLIFVTSDAPEIRG